MEHGEDPSRLIAGMVIAQATFCITCEVKLGR